MLEGVHDVQVDFSVEPPYTAVSAADAVIVAVSPGVEMVGEAWATVGLLKAAPPPVQHVPVVMASMHIGDTLDPVRAGIEGALSYVAPIRRDVLVKAIRNALTGGPEPAQRRKAQMRALEALARFERGETETERTAEPAGIGGSVITIETQVIWRYQAEILERQLELVIEAQDGLREELDRTRAENVLLRNRLRDALLEIDELSGVVAALRAELAKASGGDAARVGGWARMAEAIVNGLTQGLAAAGVTVLATLTLSAHEQTTVVIRECEKAIIRAPSDPDRAPSAPRPRLTRLEQPSVDLRRDPAAPLSGEEERRLASLSTLQRELLDAVASTPTVRRAAENLGVERANVYASLRRIARKLDIRTVPELVTQARAGRFLGR